MQDFFPKYYTSKAISLYIAALAVSNLIFFSHVLSPLWWIFGLVEVIVFFNFTSQMTRRWKRFKLKRFTRDLFWTALIIRLVWVVFSYFFYDYMTGQPFEFEAGDSRFYHDSGQAVANFISSGHLNVYIDSMIGQYSDMGYPLYLGVIYSIVGNSIFVVRILKALMGAYSCVLIYKLATRTFGEEVGRMAAIFCMIMPNLIYYCGLHTKEVEMVFITVAFMERADALFRNKNFNFMEIAPPLLLAASMFFFRTVLGATALFAMFTTLVMSSSKILGMGKRVILIIWIFGTIGYFVGGKLSSELETVWSARTNNQENSMQWRSVRDNGNKFSKYATGAVFAPMIFAIPFPTVIQTPRQDNQQLINGGNYVKNIMAFFTIFALIRIIKDGKWRENILMGSFTLGYLIILSMSAFAQSERFHQPALPFSLIFAAYGLSVMTKRDNKYYTWYIGFIFIAIVGWSWFKLAGRGMV